MIGPTNRIERTD